MRCARRSGERPSRRGRTAWSTASNTFDGTEHELAHTEPKRGHALHGLVAWHEFIAMDEAEGRVMLATTIEAQEAYGFRTDS